MLGKRGIHSIHTGNDGQNAAMLAVNHALGYEFLPALIELGKDLNDSSNCNQEETLC